MKKRNWKEVLKSNQGESVDDQKARLNEIVHAFKEFWNTNPSEDEFNKYTSGIIISPRMFYYMATHKKK